mmetsp:Transcript_6592/g.7547  ORF Transcript_6592/g.7547 Transcript_6592/m.7547 type:complete len:317 (+) Transcript_6592:133-1083(+)
MSTSVQVHVGDSVEKVRILVVGDSGVGKSCLIHQICHGKTLSTPTWTVGCHTDVKLQSCVLEGVEKPFFIEFWEVGGHRNFKPGRQMFYQKMNGVILVYDMKNVKSFSNLRSWIAELAIANKNKRDGIEEKSEATHSYYSYNGTSSCSITSHVSLRANPYSFQEYTSSNGAKIDTDSETEAETKQQYIRDTFRSLPMIIVGNKADLILGSSFSAPPNTIQTYGIPSVNLSSLKAETDKLSRFFQRVVEHRHYPHLQQQARGSGFHNSAPTVNNYSINETTSPSRIHYSYNDSNTTYVDDSNDDSVHISIDDYDYSL